jgi:pimeloyl-ACP methyl ester carboxylesterase
VLIVWGMKDNAFRPYQLDRWQQLLPEVAVVRIDGAGHWPHEEEAAQVVAAMQRFLQD